MTYEERQSRILQIYTITGISYDYLESLDDKEILRLYKERVIGNGEKIER